MLVPGVRVSGTVTIGATTVTAAVTFTNGSGSTPAPEGVPF
jgi:hypothetical protein